LLGSKTNKNQQKRGKDNKKEQFTSLDIQTCKEEEASSTFLKILMIR
jgi:hypothetical protein